MRRTFAIAMTILLASVWTAPALAADVKPTMPAPWLAQVKEPEAIPVGTLARYSDSFDRISPALWERSEPVKGTVPALISSETGRMALRCMPTGASSGALMSRFYLGGDFDVTVRLDADFNERSRHIDRLTYFGMQGFGETPGISSVIMFQLQKDRGARSGHLNIRLERNGKPFVPDGIRGSGFNGMLRFVRTGGFITALAKHDGWPGWVTLGSYDAGTLNMRALFGVDNRTGKEIKSAPDEYFEAFYDDFRIFRAERLIRPSR